MRGLLFSQMEPPPELERDFHDWYEHEHIPARMALPGFASAIRYEAAAGTPRYLAAYFLDDTEVLESPAYRRLKDEPSERTAAMLGAARGFTRYICDETSDTGEVEEEPGSLSVVAFAVPDADRAEFDAWYEEEHVPILIAAPAWLRVRRYVARPGGDGPPWTHLALHDLRDDNALASPERAAARSTARRAALAARPWFGDSGRWLYRPIHATSPIGA